ncbi:MAG: cytochrome c [Noviherbaspirillum sp.]
MDSTTVSRCLCACILGLALAPAAAADTDGGRGAMLYSTHCIACHTSQVHWRDKRLATDWSSLENQVRRWQRNTGLSWTDEDVAAVAHHLNNLYYHFPVSGQERAISLAGPGAHIASMNLLSPSGRAEWKNTPDKK